MGTSRRSANKTANKTQPTAADVSAFIERVEHPERRADAQVLVELMARVSGAPATLWGSSIIGFGSYHYRYDSGREGDMCVVGFSPRKAETVVYIVAGFAEYQELLARLGKHRTGQSCLYIKRLADIDMTVLEEIVTRGVAAMAPRRTA
jgi:Domain of unknown function (DU1801)